ncbi:hypothetical protein CHY08_08925 [Rhizobium leguminosarum bv. viciae]|nr:hypothetical protein CHY08_08925 [Rhizobium leguminosarum bv. viciae]
MAPRAARRSRQLPQWSRRNDALPPSLIPVLVTGIQRAQVFGRCRLLFAKRSIHGADAPWLDSCDIPRALP